MLGFVARSNFILQSGKLKRNIVFWNKQTARKTTAFPHYMRILTLLSLVSSFRFITDILGHY